jgi:hypothetical protein
MVVELYKPLFAFDLGMRATEGQLGISKLNKEP